MEIAARLRLVRESLWWQHSLDLSLMHPQTLTSSREFKKWMRKEIRNYLMFAVHCATRRKFIEKDETTIDFPFDGLKIFWHVFRRIIYHFEATHASNETEARIITNENKPASIHSSSETNATSKDLKIIRKRRRFRFSTLWSKSRSKFQQSNLSRLRSCTRKKLRFAFIMHPLRRLKRLTRIRD